MARAKAKRRKRRGFTLPVAVVAGFLPGATNAWSALQSYGANGMATQLSRDYLGYDPKSQKWYSQLMWGGAWPLLIGLVVHKGASMLGVNRALANAGIPILRI